MMQGAGGFPARKPAPDGRKNPPSPRSAAEIPLYFTPILPDQYMV